MRSFLIFVLLSTMMFRSLSSSELSVTPTFYMFLSMPPDPGVNLVSDLDGNIHLVDTKVEKIIWSFPTGRSIYKSSQASFISPSQIYIDVDESWELFFYSKRGGKMKKLSWSAEEFIGRMPYISKNGEVTVGAMKITVFLVDAKSGRVVDNYVVDFWASTSGFQSDDNKPVLPVDGYKEFGESNLGNLKTVRKMFYVTRTDYVLQSTSSDSGEILWNVTYADIKAELRCLAMGNSFSGYHFDSASELIKKTNLIADVESLLPCQPHIMTAVYRLRDNNLSEFLCVIGKEDGWIYLSISLRNPLIGPVHRKLQRALPDKVDRPLLTLPSFEAEIPFTLPGGSFSGNKNTHTFAEGFRSHKISFFILLIALCLVIGFLLYHSKQDKLSKHPEESIIKTGTPKKKNSKR